MNAKSRTKHPPKSDSNQEEEVISKGTVLIITLVTRLISQVGIVGLFILFIMGMMAFVASDSQQTEFIDRWFLFKHVCQSQIYAVVAILILVILYVLQAILGHKRRQLDKAEIKRIGDNNHQLQSLLINNRSHK